MPKWDNCILCNGDIKATPKHVEKEHNMSYQQYKNILEEKGVSPDKDKKESKNMSKDIEDEEDKKPSTSEQAVSQIAYDSFRSTMQEMSERKQELKEKEKQAEHKKEQLQERLYRMKEKENTDRGRRAEGGVEEELKDWMIRNYIEDLREDKRKGIEREVDELKEELRNVDSKIETEIEEKLRNVIREFTEEDEDENEKKKGQANLEITDESVKAVTNLGEQVIAYLRQNQAMKYATMSGNKDLIEKQVQQGMGNPMLEDLNGVYNDVAGGDVENMVGSPNNPQQKSDSEVKTLKEILEEEEE